MLLLHLCYSEYSFIHYNVAQTSNNLFITFTSVDEVPGVAGGVTMASMNDIYRLYIHYNRCLVCNEIINNSTLTPK